MATPRAPRPTTVAAFLAAGTTYSFEFFPPRTDEAEVQLRHTLTELEPLRPSFVSITYGAGGSTRDRTHGLVVDILRRTSMTPMAHLTCVGHSRVELADILERYRCDGVENILALRGDPPDGTELDSCLLNQFSSAGDYVTAFQAPAGSLKLSAWRVAGLS